MSLAWLAIRCHHWTRGLWSGGTQNRDLRYRNSQRRNFHQEAGARRAKESGVSNDLAHNRLFIAAVLVGSLYLAGSILLFIRTRGFPETRKWGWMILT